MKNQRRSTLRVEALWQGTPKSKLRAEAHTDYEHALGTGNQSRSTLWVEAEWKGTPKTKPRAGAYSKHEEPKQEHIVYCTVHLSVVAHMDSRNTPLKEPIIRTKQYIQDYAQKAHCTQLDSSFISFLLWSLYQWFHSVKIYRKKGCYRKYLVKLLQSIKTVFVNMTGQTICHVRHVFNNQNSNFSSLKITAVSAHDNETPISGSDI